MFYLKYSVIDIEDRIRVAKKELEIEKKNRHILRAEWKELTTPERIQRLTMNHLNMCQIEPKQLTEYDPSIFHNSKKKPNSRRQLSRLISEMLEKSKEED